MNNIIIVTNEVSIVDSTLKLLYNDPDYVKIENVPYYEGTPYARWIDSTNEETKEMCANPSGGNRYNVLRVPLSGFVYMIAYSRYYNRVNDNNMIVCMKELFPTMVFGMEKYHMFLYGKSQVTRHDFEEWFTIADSYDDTGNVLLSSDYDIFIDMARENKIPLVSEDLANIL